MNRIAKVMVSGHLVGLLEEEEVAGATRFTYSVEWLSRPDAVPVSLTLPLRPESYLQKGLHPFFENLLPEGWLFDLSSKKLKISKDDAFGMLMATCGDCIGDVEIEPLGPEGDGSGLGNYGVGFIDGSGYGTSGLSSPAEET